MAAELISLLNKQVTNSYTLKITLKTFIHGEQRKRREADIEGVGEETQSLTVEHLRPFTYYTWEVAAVSGVVGQGQGYL